MSNSLCANDYTAQALSNDDIVKILGRFRAKKSRLLKSQMDKDKAISMAAKVIPANFPENRLPADLRSLRHQKVFDPTDSEVQEFVAQAIERGEMTLVSEAASKPTRSEAKQTVTYDSDSAALTKLVEMKTKLHVTEKARSEAEAKLNVTKREQGEDFEPKRLLYIAATLTLYALIVPSTASIFSAVLEHLESPFPTWVISYALALIIDGVAVGFVSIGFKNLKSKRGYQALAVAAGLIVLNAAGLYYKMTHTSSTKQSKAIAAQEIVIEKARLHWLESKWRKESNPVACEASPSECGTPYVKASRSRQNKYELEKAKLNQLTTSTAIDTDSLIHAGYFLLFWLLLGLVSHLKNEEVGA